MPDVYSYVTTRGISYSVVSGYEFNEHTMSNFGFETVFGEDSATEYSIGIDRIAKLSIPSHYNCTATFGQGFRFRRICYSSAITLSFHRFRLL